MFVRHFAQLPANDLSSAPDSNCEEEEEEEAFLTPG